ncbi:unnamed protein product [Effrenium voratum]|nr:unnamed protein product [Effrenium voratum]
MMVCLSDYTFRDQNLRREAEISRVPPATLVLGHGIAEAVDLPAMQPEAGPLTVTPRGPLERERVPRTLVFQKTEDAQNMSSFHCGWNLGSRHRFHRLAAMASLTDSRSRWWSRFRTQHAASGYMLQAAKVVGSESVGLAARVLKDRERGVTPRCDFTVTSIDTAIVDGIILRGSLLLPKGLEGPFPSVLLRTPYGRKAEMGQSVLARQGYAVLVQDTRGRFSSSGEFVPVQHEQMDGEATVAWMRKQPWCSGKVGVTGASYLGFTAWACVDGAQVDAIAGVFKGVDGTGSGRRVPWNPVGGFR